jgi:hypothetical protein
VFDLFGLPQMPPIVRRDHEESGGNAESDEREEWIPEPLVIGIRSLPRRRLIDERDHVPRDSPRGWRAALWSRAGLDCLGARNRRLTGGSIDWTNFPPMNPGCAGP